MRKIVKVYLTLIILFFVATASINSNPNADTGHTGATGTYCTSCHSDYSLNSGGGSVTVSGLPSGFYQAGVAYPFTVTVNFPSATIKKWGFAIKAVNPTGGAAVGTFSTTNTTYTRISNNEATSKTAPSTAAGANSYTFTGLTWTAPTTGSTTPTVKFYYVGNAADGDGSEAGDYIYAGNVSIALPISLTSFSGSLINNTVQLNWQIESQETLHHFEVERENSLGNFENMGSVTNNNTSSATKYNFVDIAPNLSKNVYRLKMVEKDGNTQYSKIITIQSKIESIVVNKVFPNPVKNGENIYLEIASPKNEKTTIGIYNAQGKLITQKQLNINNGINHLLFKLPVFLLQGNYYLTVTTNNELIKKVPLVIIN